MQTLPASYPPPLSSPPTVESLERLLTGLQRPLRDGVPAPPDTAAAPVTRPVPTVVTPTPPSTLTWSAHAAGARTAGRRVRVWWVALVALGTAAAAAGAAGIRLP